jgi:SAM-dependent methyltransferase
MFRFLDLSMVTMGVYQEVLKRTKHGEKFLDLGCCLGQEIRKLVLDGAPCVNTYGSDLRGDFFSIGYELFRDEDRLRTTFIAADIFNDSSQLTTLAGQMNIIYTGALFHLFALDEQEKIAVRIVQLLAPQAGSMLCGQQSGNEIPGEYSRSGDTSGRKHFRHSPGSWKEMWDRVSERTQTRWSVEADLQSPEFNLVAPEGESTEKQNKEAPKGLRFVIRRL